MKVLIVEDDIVSRELFQLVVEREGYECVCAVDGIDGLEKFNDFLPDVVISDISMPNLDGISLLKSIKQVERNAIVIMVTAHGNEEIALQALQAGAGNYIKKPVNISELKAQLYRYNSIVKKAIDYKSVTSLVENETIELSFQSDLELIPAFVECLVNIVKHLYSSSELVSLELGLSELLLNAVEHGNYGITKETKDIALKNNTLTKLYNERKNHISNKNKKVYVRFSRSSDCCEWVIRDEGDGFDYSYIPTSQIESLSTGLQGRGVFISKIHFDEVQYLGNGNIVLVKKNINNL